MHIYSLIFSSRTISDKTFFNLSGFPDGSDCLPLCGPLVLGPHFYPHNSEIYLSMTCLLTYSAQVALSEQELYVIYIECLAFNNHRSIDIPHVINQKERQTQPKII